MKKNYLLFTLLLCFNYAWGHDAEVDGIFYNLKAADKTATVTYMGKSYYLEEYSGNVIIPENVTVDGEVYTVTSVGMYCFAGCGSLTSVTIPSSVTSLEYGSFTFMQQFGLHHNSRIFYEFGRWLLQVEQGTDTVHE